MLALSQLLLLLLLPTRAQGATLTAEESALLLEDWPDYKNYRPSAVSVTLSEREGAIELTVPKLPGDAEARDAEALAVRVLGRLYLGATGEGGPLGPGGRLEELGLRDDRTWTVSARGTEDGQVATAILGAGDLGSAGHEAGETSFRRVTQPAARWELAAEAARAGCASRTYEAGGRRLEWFDESGAFPIRIVQEGYARDGAPVADEMRLTVRTDGTRRTMQLQGQEEVRWVEDGMEVVQGDRFYSRAVYEDGVLVGVEEGRPYLLHQVMHRGTAPRTPAGRTHVPYGPKFAYLWKDGDLVTRQQVYSDFVAHYSVEWTADGKPLRLDVSQADGRTYETHLHARSGRELLWRDQLNEGDAATFSWTAWSCPAAGDPYVITVPRRPKSPSRPLEVDEPTCGGEAQTWTFAVPARHGRSIEAILRQRLDLAQVPCATVLLDKGRIRVAVDGRVPQSVDLDLLLGSVGEVSLRTDAPEAQLVSFAESLLTRDDLVLSRGDTHESPVGVFREPSTLRAKTEEATRWVLDQESPKGTQLAVERWFRETAVHLLAASEASRAHLAEVGLRSEYGSLHASLGFAATPDGREALHALSAAAVGARIYLVVDGVVLASVNVAGPIGGHWVEFATERGPTVDALLRTPLLPARPERVE